MSIRFVRSFVPSVFLVGLLAAAPAAAVPGTTLQEDLWVAGGMDSVGRAVQSVVEAGGRLYVGGTFSLVGPPTGSGVPLDVATGQRSASFPKVNGDVKAIVADDSGGWYLAGGFTAVGGTTRNRLAHVLADGTVDPSFDPNVVGGDVEALALSGDGTVLYLGGSFTSVGGTTRNRLAAVQTADSQLTGWNPSLSKSGVRSLALAADESTMYVGGFFFNASIGGASRTFLAEVDTATGSATSWNPAPSDQVRDILVDGSTIYLGGEFTTVGGASRSKAGAIDAGTGLATAWDPSCNFGVYSLAKDGSTIYLAGFFRTVGGQSRNNLAAVDAVTGAVSSWNPNANDGSFGKLVNEIVLSPDGATAYVGGQFTRIGNDVRHRLAAIDTTSGAASSWDPRADDEVFALALSGSTLHVGGRLTSVNGTFRNGLAELDLGTGEVTAWDPAATRFGNASSARSLAVSPDGSTLYVGGNFDQIAGQTRFFLASFDVATGALTAWDPDPNREIAVVTVAPDGQTVFIAGSSLSDVGGTSRTQVAAVDATTGVATAFNPTPNGPVRAIAVSPDGGTAYLGGAFSQVSSTVRENLAAANATTGVLTSWAPNPFNSTGGGGSVEAIDVSPDGSEVLVGGNFTTFGTGDERKNVARILAADGSIVLWNPKADQPVAAARYLEGGSQVALGGSFTLFEFFNVSRGRAAVFDVSSGTVNDANPLAWDPLADSGVNALLFGPCATTLVGSFRSVSGERRGGIVRFPDPQPTVGFTAASSDVSEGTTPASLTIELSAASGCTVSIDYAVSGGSATGGGVDYTLAAGTLDFPAGTTSRTIDVAIVDDAACDEGDETIVVTLSGALGGVLGTSEHTLTILENDSSPASPGNSLDVTMSATVDLSWDPVAGADSYDVLRCDASSGPCTPVVVDNQPGTTWADPDGTGAIVWYEIIARNGCGTTE